MRDMSIYEERDGLLAKVKRLRGVLDMYTAANTEALKAIAGLYAEAEDQRAAYGFLEVEVAEQIAKVTERDATIARVKALCDEHDRIGFVTVEVVLASLDGPANKLTTIDTKGESRHA